MKSTIKERESKMKKVVREIVKRPELVKELGLIPIDLIESLTGWYKWFPEEIEVEFLSTKNKKKFVIDLQKLVREEVKKRIIDKRVPTKTLVKYAYIFNEKELRELSKINEGENVLKLVIIVELFQMMENTEVKPDDDDKVAEATAKILKCMSNSYKK